MQRSGLNWQIIHYQIDSSASLSLASNFVSSSRRIPDPEAGMWLPPSSYIENNSFQSIPIFHLNLLIHSVNKMRKNTQKNPYVDISIKSLPQSNIWSNFWNNQQMSYSQPSSYHSKWSWLPIYFTLQTITFSWKFYSPFIISTITLFPPHLEVPVHVLLPYTTFHLCYSDCYLLLQGFKSYGFKYLKLRNLKMNLAPVVKQFCLWIIMICPRAHLWH